jgi:hypothetical protein
MKSPLPVARPHSDDPDRLPELIGDMVGLVEIDEFRAALLQALRR